MTHVVLFRTGGETNFKWHASLRINEREALKTAKRVRRMGYAAFYETWTMFDTLGLPTTYVPGILRLGGRNAVSYQTEGPRQQATPLGL